MLERIATIVVRRRRWVLGVAAVVFVAAGAFGSGVFGALKTGGFEDPSSASARGARDLVTRFGQGEPNLVLVITATHGSVDDPATAARAEAMRRRLVGEEDVQAEPVSYWSLGSPAALRSQHGDKALILARITGDETHVNERAGVLAAAYRAQADDLIGVAATGQAVVFQEVGHTIEGDLAKAEGLAFPLTAIALVLVFGSAVAAGLPLAVGLLSIVLTLATLRGIAMLTDVSVFSINLTTALGLGLAIDYSLFMVSRYREERRTAVSDERAVIRTVLTAGRTVLFSALTVAASLAALLVFPFYFLRSFAYAGMAVVACAAVGAIVVLPALLAALGPNIDRFRVFKRSTERAEGTGFWHRLATGVMRRPVPIASIAIIALLVLGAPFVGVHFSLPDDRVLPAGAAARQASEVLRTDFASQETATVSIVSVEPTASPAAVEPYAGALSRVAGVARVDAATGSYVGGMRVLPGGDPLHQRFAVPGAGTYLSVVPSVEPLSADGEALIAAVRAVPTPFPVRVTGQSAQLVDSKDSLFGSLPLAGGLIALSTFAVLFLMFGSLLVPAKALVLNLLSLSATFGAMVFIFQEGHGAGLLSFTATGALDTTTPILMFCIAFGLSMDYEVFLLSRIKEEHDRGSSSTDSVAMGLERTGRIVTAAAALLAIVFISFATSGITFIKLFGLGLTMAVLVDATVIRGLLVPAFMRLAGEANWWAPGPLRRLHDRIGFSETIDLDDDPTPEAGPSTPAGAPTLPPVPEAAGRT